MALVSSLVPASLLQNPVIPSAFLLLAAVGTYLVFKHLAAMTADNPDKGSFCSYARKAYGRWAGFSNGWVYWFAEMLITGSQLTAISLLPLVSICSALGVFSDLFRSCPARDYHRAFFFSKDRKCSCGTENSGDFSVYDSCGACVIRHSDRT